MSLKKMLESRSKNQELLKGSDLPAGIDSVKIEIARIRQSPDEIKAPAIIEFKNPIYGKSALAVNITNLKKLMKLVDDDENDAVGKEIELKVISVRHPTTNEIVPSLAITQVR